MSAYVNTYLKEEIIAEQIVRKIDRFRHFLPVAAQANGRILNFSKIHQQSGVEEKSVARFFEVLVDTLVGFYLESYSQSVRKQQHKKPKFYFFDTGVTRAMADRLESDLVPETSEFGLVFEQFILLELKDLNGSSFIEEQTLYFRTTELRSILGKTRWRKLLLFFLHKEVED